MRIITGDEALRTRQDSQFLPRFSKLYESGMTAVTYYRIVYNKQSRRRNVVVGACWGHKVDFNKVPIGKDFVRSNAIIKENKPASVDALLQFSRIAPAYKDGEKASKVKMALSSGQPEPIIQQQIKSIELAYEGGKVGDKEVAPTESVAVGPLTYLITTECVFVPLDSDGKPKVADIRLCSQELSNKKLEQVGTAINDRRMVIEEEKGYAELQYAFGNTKDKKQDGQVAPTGTPATYTLEEKYPDLWPTILDQVKRLPEDSEQIMARNRAFDKVDEEEIIAAISAFAAGNNMYLGMIDENDKKNINRMKNNAALLKELNAGKDIRIDEVSQAIEEAVLETPEQKKSRTAALLEESVNDAIKANEDDRDDVLNDEAETKTEEKKEENTNTSAETGIEKEVATDVVPTKEEDAEEGSGMGF